MKKILLLALVLSCTSVFAQKKEVLFDGTNLDKWHSWKSDRVNGWTIEDGVLTTKGKTGDLVTNDIYGDFELNFKFKVSPKGNSGIIYKIIEKMDETYFNTYASGPEYQIIDDVNYPAPINDVQKTGANYDVNAPNDLTVVKAAGNWNDGKIRIKKNKVEHWLNGKLVVSYTYGSDEWAANIAKSKFAKWPLATPHHEGKISLQGHGDQVWFKDITIKKM
jgi:hypothetical protein